MLPAAGALLAVFAFALTRLLLPALERAAQRWGPLDRPSGRKDHPAPTPLVGGVAVFAAVALPSLLGLAAALGRAAAAPLLPEEVARHLPGLLHRADQLAAILLGSGAMLVLGYADDRRALSPWVKLGAQVAVALLVTAAGVRVTAYLPEPWMHVVLTVVVLVFVTNAVNFVDNMNGLCGGLVLVAATHLLVVAVSSGQLFVAAILLCLAGGLVAFLPANYPGGRVFLGDAGTLALGFLLGSITAVTTFEEGGASLRPILIPLAVLAVPLADGLVAALGRLARGVHPFTAGHDHLSHRLLARGLDRRQAVRTLWALAAVLGLPAWILAGASAVTVLAIAGPVLAYLVWLGLKGSP